MKNREKADQLLNMRKNMQLNILQNPNYFGTITDVGLNKIYKPVIEIKEKNYFERLGCVSYNSGTGKLNAVVILKRASGYLGKPGKGGSKEYVRFYLDYTGAGQWVDVGVTSVNVYDHSFEEELFYDVELKLTPVIKHFCSKASVLPKVRAILSWNMMPQQNKPDLNFVWGDVKETNVHITPKNEWIGLLNNLLNLTPAEEVPA